MWDTSVWDASVWDASTWEGCESDPFATVDDPYSARVPEAGWLWFW